MLAQKVLTKVSTGFSNFSIKTSIASSINAMPVYQGAKRSLYKRVALSMAFTSAPNMAFSQETVRASGLLAASVLALWIISEIKFTPHTCHSCLSIVKKCKPGDSHTFACAVKITPGYSECETVSQHQHG